LINFRGTIWPEETTILVIFRRSFKVVLNGSLVLPS
jgi:hypothetical protein